MKEDKTERQKMNNDFIELTYCGEMMIEKISIRKSSVVSVQKPKNHIYGCIVQVMSEKFPVEETYEEVLKMLASPKILHS